MIRPQVSARAAGQTTQLTSTTLRPGQRAELAGEIEVKDPRRWGIRRGRLYRLDVTARGPGNATAGYRNIPPAT